MARTAHRNTIFTEILICVLAFLNFFFIPLLILSFLPIYVFRYTVYLSSKVVKPQLGKILNFRSSLFATDDIYNKPRAPLISVNFLEGVLGLEDFRTRFLTRIIQGKNLNGELTHPELQQYISTWMGFYFWKWDRAFNIQKHIREYDGPVKFDVFTEQVAAEISADIVAQPFVRHQSPWEIFVFPNGRVESDGKPEVPQSAIMIRIHHAAADGYSILKLLSDVGGDKSMSTAQPSYRKKSMCRQILEGITLIFRLPYDATSTVVRGMDPMSQFHLPEAKLSRKQNAAFTQRIPLSYIKEIKDAYKVSFAGIVISALAGALRSLMEERGVKVPEYVSLVTPMPFPGHPNKLRNHMTAAIISLPVGISDPETRLRVLEKHLTQVRKSTFPLVAFWLPMAIGGLFTFMMKAPAKLYGPTAIFTNFPGPANKINFAGLPVSDCFLYGGFLPGNIGLGIGSLSYNGNLRISAMIDESIISSSEMSMDGFIDNVLKELDVLKQRQIV